MTVPSRLKVRLAFAATVVAGALAATSALGAPAQARTLRAHFQEGPVAPVTCDDPRGICQAILTGTGRVTGFGAATEVTGLTQDRGVSPCGATSDSEAYTRRIAVAGSILALRASGIKCPLTRGFEVRARFVVDGRSSTGRFAGARGSGIDTVRLPAGEVRIRGRIRLR